MNLHLSSRHGTDHRQRGLREGTRTRLHRPGAHVPRDEWRSNRAGPKHFLHATAPQPPFDTVVCRTYMPTDYRNMANVFIFKHKGGFRGDRVRGVEQDIDYQNA